MGERYNKQFTAWLALSERFWPPIRAGKEGWTVCVMSASSGGAEKQSGGPANFVFDLLSKNMSCAAAAAEQRVNERRPL